MFTDDVVFDELIGGFGDVDAPGFAGVFHAGGGVDGVAPNVVGEFFDTDNAGNDGAAVDADADLEGCVVRGHVIDDIDGGTHDAKGVILR